MSKHGDISSRGQVMDKFRSWVANQTVMEDDTKCHLCLKLATENDHVIPLWEIIDNFIESLEFTPNNGELNMTFDSILKILNGNKKKNYINVKKWWKEYHAANAIMQPLCELCHNIKSKKDRREWNRVHAGEPGAKKK